MEDYLRLFNSEYEYEQSGQEMVIGHIIPDVSFTKKGFYMEYEATSELRDLDKNAFDVMIKAVTFKNGKGKIWFEDGMPMYINEGAFSGCTNLINININSIIGVRNYAFSGCTNLIGIGFSQDGRGIGEGAFKGCTNLQYVNGHRVQTIGDYAFEGCTNLTDAKFIYAMEVGEGAFSGCTSLRNVELSRDNAPSSVTIKRNAFTSCSSLREITIPSYTSIVLGRKYGFIEANAFVDCENLETIRMSSVTPPEAPTYDYGEGIFENCHPDFRIYIPIEAYERGLYFNSEYCWCCYDSNNPYGCGDGTNRYLYY